MADGLLPDIPADLFNSWSADQFSQAVQDKISGLGGDVQQGVQNLLAPPAPTEPPPTVDQTPPAEPAPAPEAPAAPPEPAPAPPPPPPPPAPEAAPAPDTGPPDLGATPAVSSDVSAAPAPAPMDTTPAGATPTPTPTPSTSTSTSGWDIGALLGAADSAGANMGQFAASLPSNLQSAGSGAIGAVLGAADQAGANMSQFSGQLGDLVPQAAQAAQQGAQGTTQALTSSVGNVPDWLTQLISQNAPGDLANNADFIRTVAAGAKAESGWDPNAVQQNGGGRGLFQFDLGGMGAGIPESQLLGDAGAALQASRIVPLYAKAYQNAPQGLSGADLASWVAGQAERPYDFTNPQSAARQNYAAAYNAIGGAIGGAVQQAASTGQQAVNTVTDAAQSAVARTSQFAMGLSSGDAMAFCGPAAAMAFAETFGRNPTVQEAKQLAQQVGWNPDQGMAGPSSEVSLLNKLGIDTHMTQGVDWNQVASDASSGNPVIIDTPGHYFYVDGYNAQTGQFHFGTSATDLKASGGQSWFTPDQMNNLGMGSARAAIFADHPLASDPSVASGSSQSASISNFLSGPSQFASSVGQQAQDTMSAVLNAGASTAQDATQGVSDWLDSQKSKFSDTLQNAAPAAQTVEDLLSQAGQTAQDVASSGAAQDVGGVLNALSGLGGDLTPQGIAAAGARVGSLQPGESTDLGPLSVGPMPSDSSRIPLSVGGVDVGGITGLNAGDVLTKALLGDQSSTLAGQTLQQLLTPTNYFFGPTGLLAGLAMPSGSDIGGSIAAALGGDQTAQTVGQLAGGLGAGLLAPATLERLAPAALSGGLSLLDLLSSPEIAYATTRQAGESAADYLARIDPEHAGNAAQAVYNAAVQANIAPATGAGLLQSAMDDLGAYPEEIANPIRQFASATDAPASDVAGTIRQWMAQHPLESVPNPITGPSQAARDVGQQAVSDIADAVMSGRTSAFPPGSIPDLLSQGATQQSSADQVLQDLLEGLTGKQAPRVPSTAGYLPPGTMPGQLDLGLGSATDLTNRIAQTPDEALQAWAQQALGRGAAQPGLPVGTGGSLADLLSQLPTGQRTYQMPFNQAAQLAGQQSLQDLIDSLTASARTEAAAPSGNIASGLGQYIASALSPTENLSAQGLPEAQSALEDFAAMVGRQSNAAARIAHTAAVTQGLGPDVEETMARGLRTQATNDLMARLRQLKLAAPVGADPAGPGFTAPKGQGWQLASKVPGSPLSRWAVDPRIAGPINAVVGRSAIAENPLGRAILNAGSVGKGAIFSLSNFHTYTEALNSLFSSPQTAKNMAQAFASNNFFQGLERGSLGQTLDNAARAGVTSMLSRVAPDVETTARGIGSAALKRGIAGTLSGVGSGAAGYAEAKITGQPEDVARQQAVKFGLAGAALAGLPMGVGGRGTVAEELSNALWQRAIPVAKGTAWQSLVDGGMEARTAAKVVNERFGGLNYAMMGRSPTLQDALRLGVMAPDWGESTIRQAGRVLGGPGAGEARGFLGKAIGGTLATTELLNYALSGHSTVQNQPGHQFEVEVKDPAGGYTHVGLIPGNFLTYLNLGNKLATDTSAKRGADLLNFVTGREAAIPAALTQAGQALGSSNSLRQPYGYSKAGPATILSNFAPIGLDQIAQGINSGGLSPELAIAMAALGLNPRYTNPTTTAGTTPGRAAASASVPGRAAPVAPRPSTSSSGSAGRAVPVTGR